MDNLVGILWIVQRVQHEAAACFHSVRRIHRTPMTTATLSLHTVRAHRDNETATHLRIGFSLSIVYPNYWFSRRESASRTTHRDRQRERIECIQRAIDSPFNSCVAMGKLLAILSTIFRRQPASGRNHCDASLLVVYWTLLDCWTK